MRVRNLRAVAVVTGAVALVMSATAVTWAADRKGKPDRLHLVVSAWRDPGTGFDPNNLTELVSAFEKRHKNIDVDIVYDEGQEAHHAAIEANLAAGGHWADVVAAEARTLTDTLLVDPDAWVDLGDHRPDLVTHYSPARWSIATTPDGRQLGLPIDLSSVAVCYRRDLFQAAGLPVNRDDLAALWPTWSDFIDVGAQYRAQTGQAFVESAGSWFESVALSQGGPFFVDESGAPVVATSAAIATAWDVSLQMIDAGMTANAPQWTNDWFAGMSDGRFAAMICPSWILGVIPANAPQQAGVWDIAPLPGDTASYWGGAWLTVPATSQHPAEAVALAAFLTAKKSALRFANAPNPTGGYLVPANLDALGHPSIKRDKYRYFNKAPVGTLYPAHAHEPASLHLGPWYSACREAMGRWLGEVERGALSPEAAWDGLVAEVTAIVSG